MEKNSSVMVSYPSGAANVSTTFLITAQEAAQILQFIETFPSAQTVAAENSQE